MGRVLVVGSLNLDLVVRCARLPRTGETLTASACRQQAGGKGLNQAVAAARCGAAVEFVGCVGDDPFGDLLRRLLAAEGIDQDGVGTQPGPSGLALIELDDAGDNRILVVSGANGALTAAQVTAAMRPGAAVLLLQGEVPVAASLRAAELQHAAGGVVIYNPAPVPPADEGLAGLLALADWVVPNAEELAALSGRPDPVSGVRALRHRTSAAILATLGAQGALLQLAGRDEVAALPTCVVPVVDTVGAGDACVGALAAALAGGAAPLEAARFALAAGALACTRPGAAAAMPQREEVARLLARP